MGAGTAGGNATALAAALGAEVTVFDRKREKPSRMRALGNNVSALYPYAHSVAEAVARADLLIGAVLVTGRRAPHVVSAEMVKGMQDGSAIIDISVDQGGCIETSRPIVLRQGCIDGFSWSVSVQGKARLEANGRSPWREA